MRWICLKRKADYTAGIYLLRVTMDNACNLFKLIIMTEQQRQWHHSSDKYISGRDLVPKAFVFGWRLAKICLMHLKTFHSIKVSWKMVRAQTIHNPQHVQSSWKTSGNCNKKANKKNKWSVHWICLKLKADYTAGIYLLRVTMDDACNLFNDRNDRTATSVTSS